MVSHSNEYSSYSDVVHCLKWCVQRTLKILHCANEYQCLLFTNVVKIILFLALRLLHYTMCAATFPPPQWEKAVRRPAWAQFNVGRKVKSQQEWKTNGSDVWTTLNILGSEVILRRHLKLPRKPAGRRSEGNSNNFSNFHVILSSGTLILDQGWHRGGNQFCENYSWLFCKYSSLANT